MKRHLVIDTASIDSLIALYEEDVLILEELLPHGFRGSREFMPMLDQLFQRVGWKPKDLTLITVGVGPGSYTGIRVGVIIGKTLSYALSIPLHAVSSLKAFYPRVDGPFTALLDARSGGYYIHHGQKKGGNIAWHPHPELVQEVKSSLIVTSDIKVKLDIPIEIVKPSSLYLKEGRLEEPLKLYYLREAVV